MINKNQSYPFGSKKFLNNLFNKMMKKFNSTALVDLDLERMMQTLTNDTEGLKNNNENHTEKFDLALSKQVFSN